MSEWDGVIFVREGPYKDGIFKFEIVIPSSYPAKPPDVIFLNEIMHPLIDLKTGKLDLTVMIKTFNRKIF
jgi:ubiquitin-protein ligase